MISKQKEPAGNEAWARAIRLSKAVWSKDAKRTQSVLAAGGDPNGLAEGGGGRLLRVALRGESFEVARALADAGALLGSDRGRAPLLSELMWDMEEPLPAVLWLLQRGADPTEVDEKEEGQSPIHFAALYGKEEALAALIEAGASVGVRNKEGMTPLMMAAHGGHLACCERLIRLGAAFEDKDEKGRDALYWARDRDRSGEGLVEFFQALQERRALGDDVGQQGGAAAEARVSRGRAL